MTALEDQQHNSTVLQNLEKGDLIEFKSKAYSHWAVYTGDQMVIHLAGDENDGLNANVNSGNVFTICGTRFRKAFVKHDDFWNVTCGSKAYKNNGKDKKMSPSQAEEIVERALEKIGELDYNVLWNNCEHFATYCRYGKSKSEQMSLSMAVVIHTIETLRVFPRAHYFQRRYHDLVPRFKRLTGAFPKSFQVEKALLEIDDLDDRFTKKIEVYVIGGSGLDLADIVVTTKPSEREKISELKEPQGTCLFICYSKTDRLDQSGLKEIKDVIETFFNDFGREKPHLVENLFVVVDTNHNNTDEEREAFRKDVHEIIREKIQDTDEQTYENRIILGSPGTVLGSKIQELLEILLVDGFHKIMAYLDRFVRKTKQYETEVDIIHSDIVVKAIQAFLRDDIGLADMRQIAEKDESKELEGMSVDEKFLVQLLKKLARLVKCAIVDPCSSKYNIPPWEVNLLLEELNFEHKLADSVSKNTKHHLRKLNEVCKDYESVLQTHKRKANMGRGKHGASRHEHFIRFVTYKFDFIVYPLQNDFSKVISDAEKTMASASQIITVMGKMMFEIEGYLEQTITEKFTPKIQKPDVPKDLRNAILELKDVYAIATVYDTFEIHVQNETNRVKEYVSTLMRKYGYTYPFQVKTVSKEPVKMMADIQHENGKLIKSPYPGNRTKFREGTLGCFAENMCVEKRLYVLTCAHVVENPEKEEHDVLIQDRGLRLKKIGKSTRRLTIGTGSGEMPLIDIAAVVVNKDFESKCIRRMKDDDGLNRTAVIATETASTFFKRFVYKHGAMSGLTKGIICSSDLCLSGNVDEDYLLMIESLPGNENGRFAERGDSGAIICTSSVDTDEIKALSMLSGGDYKLKEKVADDKFLSFLLRIGLQKLKDKSDVPLNIP